MIEEIFIVLQGLSACALLCNLAGNSMVLAILFKVKSMKTITCYLLGCLALSDLIFGCTAFTVVVFSYIMGKSGTVTERQLIFEFVGRWFVSVMTLAAIAVERYYAILKPFIHRARISERLMKRVSWIIWIVGAIMSLSGKLISTFTEEEIWERYYFVLTSFCLVVPGIIIVTCYGQIVYHIWFKTQVQETTNAGVLKSRKKLTKLLVTVTVVFFVCWTPLSLGRVFSNSKFPSNQKHIFYSMFSSCLALVGTAINPLLYCLRSPRFRQAAKELFSRLRCHKKRAVRDIQQPQPATSNEEQITPL